MPTEFAINVNSEDDQVACEEENRVPYLRFTSIDLNLSLAIKDNRWAIKK